MARMSDADGSLWLQVMLGRKESAAGEAAQQTGTAVRTSASSASLQPLEREEHAGKAAEHTIDVLEVPGVEQGLQADAGHEAVGS